MTAIERIHMLRVIFAFLPVVRSECYWNNRDPYPYFGSKTPYDTVRGDFRDVPNIEDCEPMSIWFMVRHGTRQSNEIVAKIMKETAGLKQEIIKNHVNGKGELCAQDIDDLRNWTWDEKLNYKSSHLTSEGYQELHQFGQRFVEKYKEFLENVESKYSIVRPTREQRTRKSAKAFVGGLQGIKRMFNIENSIIDDPVARPYRYCAKRGAEIINSTRFSFQIERYQETKEFKRVQENVQRKTGLNLVNSSTIMGIYNLCQYFRAFSGLKRDPWCSLLNDDDLKVLEYTEDLRDYYRNGYGHPINALTGSVALKDMYDKFHQASNTGTKSLSAYFTHDSMINMIYTAMGLYRDYPEISGYERVSDRKWRTSFMTPYAANFVAVLHRCPKLVSTLKYKIQFFENERELHLCRDRVCSWAEFQNIFQKFSNANLDFCNDYYSYTV